MASGIGPVIFPVRDLARAKAQFRKVLGIDPYADESYYVGFRLAGLEVGLDPHGHDQGMTGPVCYFEVDDIQQSIKQLLDAGAQEQRPARDVGGGKLIAVLQDAEGNPIGLSQSP